MKRKLLSLLLALVMLGSLLTTAAASPAEVRLPEEEPSVLRVGTGNLSGVFSPFFSKSTYDADVSDLTQVKLLPVDREGYPVLNGINGETRPYNGTDYTYYGIADCKITQNSDGTADYKITIRDDVKFSDGEPLTIDDVIFSMYVLADPAYDGPSQFWTLPIEGLEEYHNSMASLGALIYEKGEGDYEANDVYTQAQHDYFWQWLHNQGGAAFAQEIIDYCMGYYINYSESMIDEEPEAVLASPALQVKLAMYLWDYADYWFEGATAADFWAAMYNKHQGSFEEIDAEERIDSTILELTLAGLGDPYTSFVNRGAPVPSVTGITKLSANSLNLHMTTCQADAVYGLSIDVAPLHHYSSTTLYDYGQNKFGFPKGELSKIRARDGFPLGAGPYVFESFEDGRVTLRKNSAYYRGEPKTDEIQLIDDPYTGGLVGIAQNAWDLAIAQSFNEDAENEVRSYNSNGQLTGSTVTTYRINYQGICYIGINADLVKVGNNKGSEASKNLRKAYATVFAALREEYAAAYFGERAVLLDYPISGDSWASPKPADADYQAAFSTDVNGQPIYTAGMTQEQRLSAALEAAAGYLEAAGFTRSNGRFNRVPTFTVCIPGAGVGDHPAYALMLEAAEALDTIGVKLEVTDMVNSGEFWDALYDGSIAIWSAAWTSIVDPNLRATYHSENISPNGTATNFYRISSVELDALLDSGRDTLDQAARKQFYRQALDVIMDWGVTVPYYQRQNAIFASTGRVKTTSLPADMTPFYGWKNEIETLVLRSNDPAAANALRVSAGSLSGLYSPFFSTSNADADVSDLTQVKLLTLDREGYPVLSGINGETRPYYDTDYTYHGLADCEVKENSDGSVDYKITIRDDVRFSDGKPLTIDDVIFSMYVLADPSYDGPSGFRWLPISGMEDYVYSMDLLGNVIHAYGDDEYVPNDVFTQDQFETFWNYYFEDACEDFAQEIIDYCVNNYIEYASAIDATPAQVHGSTELQVRLAMYLWGYEDYWDDGATAWDFWLAMFSEHDGDIQSIEAGESAGSTMLELTIAGLGAPYNSYVNVGEPVPAISGITRLSDTSLNIHMDCLDVSAIYDLALIDAAPLHYYGDPALYNYSQNSFGFPKGDLSMIHEKDGTPLGAGPYIFLDWSEGCATLTKNSDYYRGEPKTEEIWLVDDPASGSLSGIMSNTHDLTVPEEFTVDLEEEVRAANSTGQLTGNSVSTFLVNYIGYGYIGMNADLVKVGNDSGSEASKNLRKAYATVFAAYREESVGDYYGERAELIEYPIPNASWAAPRPGDEGYETAFSRNVNGDPIYTDGMTQSQRYAAALEAAAGYFEAAGYSRVNGKFSNVPAFTVVVPGKGEGDHPAYQLLVKASEALSQIGVELTVEDAPDGSSLWIDLDDGNIAIWAAAWGLSVDPDMYTVYHSDNIDPAGGSNRFRIDSDELDALIMQGRGTFDKAARKQIYKQAMDVVLDQAVEVPNYQRKYAAFAASGRVRTNTLPADMTMYYDWKSEIEKVELKNSANPFTDVPEGKFFYDPVLWAVNATPQITSGTSETTFSPDKTCTRAQVVTFIWRAMGEPEPQTTVNPFTDVKETAYYYKAVLWAVESGVTTGTSPTTFGPGKGCTRAQVVTFLWRAMGEPRPSSTSNPFNDVKTDQYYTNAVLWAVELGITQGTSATTFGPGKTCTRGQIVTFLFRTYAG